MAMEYESNITKNPFFIIARMSREQILAIPKEKLPELVEQFFMVPPDYDPDAPVKLRIGQWLTRSFSEGGE